MSAEELAKHRQVYWEALSSGLDNCRYGLPFTEEEKREIFAQIPDDEIIREALSTASLQDMLLSIIFTSRLWYIKK